MEEFENLIADMFEITKFQRINNPNLVQKTFYDTFEIDFDKGFELAKALLFHTPTTGGSFGTQFHAFLSKTEPVMLVKVKAKFNSNS